MYSENKSIPISTKSNMFKPRSLKDIVKNIIVLIKAYPVYKKHKINELKKLQTRKKFKGQKKYTIEFMLKDPTKMVEQIELLQYCDRRMFSKD